jgi:N-acyl amino acid synthase FeeM
MNNSFTLHPCETSQKMSDAVKLRYLAYKNAGAIEENAAAEFKDKYDLQPNTKTCIVYEGNMPVASARACIYSETHDFLPTPAFEVYREDIEREIGLDKMIVESNRLVIHPEKVESKYLFKLPFRFIILNVIKFSSDYIITAVRAKHVPVYRRFLGLEPISGLRKYPGINVEMILMAGVCSELLPLAMRKEEIFRFTNEEVDNYLFTPNSAFMNAGN